MGATSKENRSISQKLYNKNTATGISNMLVARARWDFAIDGGATSTITPKYTVTLPDNAVIVGGTVNSTTAVTGAGVSVSVGTSAGSSTTALLGATAVASLTLDARLNAVPTFATPVKLTASGDVTFTISGGTATAGVMEVVLFYWVANN